MRPEKGAFRNRSKGRLPEHAISWPEFDARAYPGRLSTLPSGRDGCAGAGRVSGSCYVNMENLPSAEEVCFPFATKALAKSITSRRWGFCTSFASG